MKAWVEKEHYEAEAVFYYGSPCSQRRLQQELLSPALSPMRTGTKSESEDLCRLNNLKSMVIALRTSV